MSHRQRARSVWVLLLASAACAACSHPPEKLHFVGSGDTSLDSTTSTTTWNVGPPTTYYFPPYVPGPTTSTTPRTKPKPAAGATPTTIRPAHTTTTVAARSATTTPSRTTVPTTPPDTTSPTIRVRGEVTLAGTWTGITGSRCSPTHSAHPDLMGAHATLTNTSGTTIATGYVYDGTIEQPSGAPAPECLITINLGSVPLNGSYTLTIQGRPPVTMTGAQLTTASGEFPISIS